MSTAAPLQTATAKPLQPPGANLILQRKCACGAGASGLTGECAECGKKKLGLQAKLRINEPGDVYEQEADRVAEQVLAKPARPDVSSAPPRIQRYTGEATGEAHATPASVDRVLASPGRPLEPALRQDMEQRFGQDFSRVRVHSGAAAERSARDVNANAYTVNHNIVFGIGRFAPQTNDGRRLLAHELTHVVQQSGSAGMALQRQPRGAAAGCGICMNDPGGRVAGDIAHTEVQDAFIAANPDMVAERPVPGIPNSGIDISYERRRSGEHVLFIGEIKPLDDAGQQAGIGRRQLQDYAREMMLSGQYDEVYRMPNAPPTGPLYFFNPMNPPGCPRQTIMVQLTERGLYQYYCEPPFSQLVRNSACGCRPRRDDEPPGPFVPPVWVRPSDQPGSSETKGKGGDQPGKGNGEPGKGDRPGKGDGEPGKGDRKPGRTPGRDQPQQPTFRLPDWVPGTALLGALGAIVAWLSKNPLGRLGAFLGTLLGRLLSALGLSIGVLGTAAGSPGGGGGPGPGAGGDKGTGGGGPPTGSVPGKTVIVPGDDVLVPGGTVTVPGPDVTKKPAGTVTVPSRDPKRKTPPVKGAPALKVPKKAERIRLALIEGLNLGTLRPGKLTMIEVDPGGANERIVTLSVKSVTQKGTEVTAEFESLLLECSLKGGRCKPGGNTYIVTHPYKGDMPNALVARAIKEVGNTEGMDETVKQIEKLIR